ncbi:MAG: hypothetical protein HYT16_02815 [DPANN group archaeon]|nr:hypothetical protein [DPANN group archaeon]
MTETKQITINVMDAALWIAAVIFLALLAWWVLGDSPTAEQISIGLTILGLLLAERSGHRLRTIEENTFKILEKVNK